MQQLVPTPAPNIPCGSLSHRCSPGQPPRPAPYQDPNAERHSGAFDVKTGRVGGAAEEVPSTFAGVPVRGTARVAVAATCTDTRCPLHALTEKTYSGRRETLFRALWGGSRWTEADAFWHLDRPGCCPRVRHGHLVARGTEESVRRLCRALDGLAGAGWRYSEVEDAGTKADLLDDSSTWLCAAGAVEDGIDDMAEDASWALELALGVSHRGDVPLIERLRDALGQSVTLLAACAGGEGDEYTGRVRVAALEAQRFVDAIGGVA